MASPEALAKATAMLSIVWPEHTQRRLGTPEARMVASAVLAEVRDDDLLGAVAEFLKSRTTLYQDDNLPGLLRQGADTIRSARHTAQAAAWNADKAKYELAAARLGLGEWSFGYKSEAPDDTLPQRFLRFLVRLRDNPDTGPDTERLRKIATVAAKHVERALSAGTDPLDFPPAITEGNDT